MTTTVHAPTTPDLVPLRGALLGTAAGAGLLAALALLSPSTAGDLSGLGADGLVWRLAGCLWLGLAVAAALAVPDPSRGRAVLHVQQVYKPLLVVLALPHATGAGAGPVRPALLALLVAYAGLVALNVWALRAARP